jgi:uncharacterized protein GlcG (DUF336 family)
MRFFDFRRDDFSGRKRVRQPAAFAPRIEPLQERILLNAADNLVFFNKAYQDLLHRPPDAGGLQSLANALNQGSTTRFQAVLGIEQSVEYRSDQLQTLYQQFLHRPADPAGLRSGVAFLNSGGTLEQLEASIVGSAEYFQVRGGGTNDGFLTALYQDALNRSVDPGARAAGDALLAAGMPRNQFALQVFISPEHESDLVTAYYQQYLHRAPDGPSLSVDVAALSQGARDETLVAGILASLEYAPGADPPDPPDTVLMQPEVDALLKRAAAASRNQDAVIVVVDRGGRILGVRVEAGVLPVIGNNLAALTFFVDGALAEARTAAFFANNEAPLTSRTVQFISQSTITQREVESNPSIADPNSPMRGPGFVAPVGLGGHFPPNVPDTPPVDLFGIEHTNRDTTMKLNQPLPNRFNVPNEFIPATIPLNERLAPPDSYGFISGFFPAAQPRGIGTLPGGIPIYKKVGGAPPELVGGIGVFFPGRTGFATEENSRLSATFNPALPDRSLEAEWMAFAAVGGDPALGLPVGTLAGVPPVPGVTLPLPPGARIDLAGITLDVVGPGGLAGPQALANFGRSLGVGNPNSGVNEVVDKTQDTLLAGTPVPDGWLVVPHAGAGGAISAADVQRIITQGITEANKVRAQIRLPLGRTTKMVFAVADSTGAVLGLFRMPDATIFSIDVAVAKARNVAYYDDPTQLQPIDQIAGLPRGVSFTNRTFRYTAQPRFPEGIDGTPPAPHSILNDPGINRANGLDAGPPLPASVYQSVYGHDSFNPGTNFHDPFNPMNQNGIVFFPGSSGVYKPAGGTSAIVGGFGVSGDGVDQDDVVTAVGATGYGPPTYQRADQFFVGGVRLPYQKFPRNPEQL